MARVGKADISPRKLPQQSRSSMLVAAVLEAAVQVLAEEGTPRFTMARVADRAGVSVGSLYQYFPNKAALLFRLQSDEWRETTAMLRAILEEADVAPLQRLRSLVRAFIRSECAEAGMRMALDDAAPLYRDAPEARKARAAIDRTFQAFMREALPHAPDGTRHLAAQLTMSTLSAVGKQFSARPRTAGQIDAHADALADMFCGYLRSLHARHP